MARPIEITDPAITNNFRVFAGPGTGPNEPHSLIIDWAAGAMAAPSGLESYRVSFFVDGYKHPYVVLYAFDDSNAQGYVYLPGKADEWYRTNTSMIFRHVEGNWFHALPRWEDVARPIIEQQAVRTFNKAAFAMSSLLPSVNIPIVLLPKLPTAPSDSGE